MRLFGEQPTAHCAQNNEPSLDSYEGGPTLCKLHRGQEGRFLCDCGCLLTAGDASFDCNLVVPLLPTRVGHISNCLDD